MLDLGCGDGPLLRRVPGAIGVDLSAGELRAAAGGARVQARADALPLGDATVDVVLSHLALMLMQPFAAIADELARVVRPGGEVVAIVGGGPVEPPAPGDAFARFLELVRPHLVAAGAPVRLGDRRARTDAGWREVLGPRGFVVDDAQRLVVDLSGDRDQVWATLLSMYGGERLDDAVRAELRAQLWPAPDDGVATPCAMVVWRLRAVRR
ncbi:MAG: class I SAM-dependent methyltransferase [Kofleriaceae bacterium]